MLGRCLLHRMGGLMKQLIKKITAFSASAVIAVCSSAGNAAIGADTTEKTTYKVHFDLSEEGVTIVPDSDGNVPEIKDVEKEYNAAVFMPSVELKREGYYFTGWTADNIYGYKGGMVYRVPDHDVTLTPVWNKKGDSDLHTVKFSVEIDGKVNEEYEKLVPAEKRPSGTLVEIPMYAFPRDGYKQYGWTDGTNIFKGQEYIIIQDEDITLTPNWYKKYLLTYTVGDADRINGATKQEYEVMETGEVELQNSSRFSRNGFEIIGWHCENDGKDYKCNQKFVMPSSDVVMTPIWFAINYNVVFFANTKSDADDLRIRGKTDTAITIPECTAVREGYTFGGWQYKDTVFQPGDEFIIPGAEPGLGISFNAIWIEGSGEQITTTTTSSITTTSATTTTTSATSSITSTTSATETTSTTTTVTEPITTTTTSTEPAATMLGDANCDGAIDMADAVLIMQALANPNKYGVNGTSPNCMTAAGKLNADVDLESPGLTTGDALVIQLYLLGRVEKFPLY